MRRIQSNVDVHSETFVANHQHNRALAADFHRRQDEARARRPERDLERLARQKKLFVRDRLELLLDPGTPFLELSTLAANMAYDGEVPGAGPYTPALSESSVIVRGRGAIFLGGPPLVKAATGEVVTADELGGCDLHTQVSGTADYPAATEPEAIAIARDIVAQWRHPEKATIEREEAEPPYYDPQELYGIIPRDIKVQFDMREIIARIV